MKYTTILFLLVSQMSFAQTRDAVDYEKINLAGKTYKSSYNVFSDVDRTEYNLEAFEANLDVYAWGNFISFEEKTFSTSYSAPCGNDCFTYVNGTYKFIGGDRIQVYVETISRSGFCQEESESPKKIIGVFQITQTETGLKLIKE